MRRPKYLYDVGVPFFRIEVYECEECGGTMTRYKDHDGKFICMGCAFKEGLASEREFLEDNGIYQDSARAEYRDGEIYVVLGGKFPWEKSDSDYRHSPEYRKWRSDVFERDGFKCQICGKVGGELNAHHIKHFKDYPKERFNVDNGVTLCVECHREIHRKERSNG